MKSLQLFIAIGSFSLMLTASKTQAQQTDVSIVKYHDGDTIKCHSRIDIKTATSLSRTSHIYLLVHPLAVTDWWVQPRFIYDAPGKWHCTAQIGQSPNQNNGQEFELIVLVNPNPDLLPVKQLQNLPTSPSQSTSITLVKNH